MMTKLMTWFNKSRLFKILTIYVLNQVDDLTSWHYLFSSRLSFCKTTRRNKMKWERIKNKDWNKMKVNVNAF